VTKLPYIRNRDLDEGNQLHGAETLRS